MKFPIAILGLAALATAASDPAIANNAVTARYQNDPQGTNIYKEGGIGARGLPNPFKVLKGTKGKDKDKDSDKDKDQTNNNNNNNDKDKDENKPTGTGGGGGSSQIPPTNIPLKDVKDKGGKDGDNKKSGAGQMVMLNVGLVVASLVGASVGVSFV